MIRYLVPSRGRPANAQRLRQAWRDTETADDTHLTIMVDEDDPTAAQYVADHEHWDDHNVFLATLHADFGGLAGILNAFAPTYAADPECEAIGFMGDDHLPKTWHWDQELLESLRQLGRPGIVYGNDLLQGANLPTAVLMSSVIPRRLGFMCPPGTQHMYLDNFWRDLGTALVSIRYRPDVVIEHRHPVAGTAPDDEGYRRVNAGEVYAHDAAAYAEFLDDDGIRRAVETING